MTVDELIEVLLSHRNEVGNVEVKLHNECCCWGSSVEEIGGVDAAMDPKGAYLRIW